MAAASVRSNSIAVLRKRIEQRHNIYRKARSYSRLSAKPMRGARCVVGFQLLLTSEV